MERIQKNKNGHKCEECRQQEMRESAKRKNAWGDAMYAPHLVNIRIWNTFAQNAASIGKTFGIVISAILNSRKKDTTNASATVSANESISIFHTKKC